MKQREILEKSLETQPTLTYVIYTYIYIFSKISSLYQLYWTQVYPVGCGTNDTHILSQVSSPTHTHNQWQIDTRVVPARNGYLLISSFTSHKRQFREVLWGGTDSFMSSSNENTLTLYKYEQSEGGARSTQIFCGPKFCSN